MPRKSQQQRLQDIKDTLLWYDDAGFQSDNAARFLADMVRRIESGKYLSKGQRDWADNLFTAGAPQPKNVDRVKAILSAAEVDGMQQMSSTLKDFAHKVGKGWSLSEKQEKFLANLLAKAETLQREGRFRPSGELLEDLNSAVAICKVKNGWYWQHRPGTAKAFGKVENWLDWNARREVIKSVKVSEPESVHALGDEPVIDKWACDKLLKAVKNPVGELKNPKFLAGAMAWTRIYAGRPNGEPRVALVSGLPRVLNGEVTYPCLVEGEMMEITTKDLRKRRG